MATEKIKVLAWGDYACGTGFGTVMKNIMGELNRIGLYDIDVIGVNYDGGPYDTKLWPGQLWPAISALRTQGPYGDVFGRQVFLDMISQRDYDLVFIIQDTFVLQPIIQQMLEIQRSKPKTFSTIYYYPFDCAPREEWVTQVVAAFDFPVAYTDYAKEETRKFIGPMADNIDVIYHGTNTKDFFPFDEAQKSEARKQIFPTLDGKFLVTNINRNQGRKDVSRSLMVLKELLNRGVDDVFLYMHMQESDFGGSIMQMARAIGVDPEKHFTIPDPRTFGAHSGFPIEFLNAIYNSSDAYITTTHGEGWGLSITEAMATKTPIVGPRNTSLHEILGQNSERGWLVDSGATPSHWIIKENDNERMRPLMNVEQAADAILEIKNNPDIATQKAQDAYDWVNQYTWKNICKDWADIFKKAASKTKSVNMLRGMGNAK
jgi:glycosyltransferase involved in cell wall biosynthesis